MKTMFLKSLATRFEQGTSFHYQAISNTDNSNLKLIQTDREGWNVRYDLLTVYLSL